MTSMPNLKELACAWAPVIAPEKDALNRLRTRGLKALDAGVWPTSKDASWRHTRLTSLQETPWQGRVYAPHDLSVGATLASRAPMDDAWAHLVFVEGRLDATQSQIPKLPKGVTLGAISTLHADMPQLMGTLGQTEIENKEVFAALNAALVDDVAVVHVAKDVVLPGPVYISFAAGHEEPGVVRQPRLLVALEHNAQAEVVECHGGASPHAAWHNCVTELFVGPGAHLCHSIVQQEGKGAVHLAHVAAKVQKDARLSVTTLDEGSLVCRRAMHLGLLESGAHIDVVGIALARDTQHVDTQVNLSHQAPFTSSNQEHRIIAQNRARGVFGGKVLVFEGADKTRAQQLCRSLLCDATASAFAQPELEILADDVKCTHGATVGQLSEDALFYLMSRALARREAQSMLTYAFVGALLNNAPTRLRPLLARRTCAWLQLDDAIAHTQVDTQIDMHRVNAQGGAD